jgi:hypothetical protein
MMTPLLQQDMSLGPAHGSAIPMQAPASPPPSVPPLLEPELLPLLDPELLPLLLPLLEPELLPLSAVPASVDPEELLLQLASDASTRAAIGADTRMDFMRFSEGVASQPADREPARAVRGTLAQGGSRTQAWIRSSLGQIKPPKGSGRDPGAAW